MATDDGARQSQHRADPRLGADLVWTTWGDLMVEDCTIAFYNEVVEDIYNLATGDLLAPQA